ncbi:hypothetical protein LCGC14_0312760 [marine sediment metagenome]|uniref:Uncharacterized protein n=1 Tax=marine sediment metagenome TaxID=412755 RepID=A0A0F9TRQ1_9ZZZZ
MPDPLVITIPGMPPSANHAFVTRSNGMRVLTREAEEYQGWVENAALAAYANGNLTLHKGQWLRLTFKAYFPDKRKRDLDNMKKVIGDGIARGLFIDDRWFLWTDDVPEVDKADPRIVVTVEEEAL